jgi:hypothetical protein
MFILYLIIFIIVCVGLDTQIQEIKESVELPLTHPEYYEEMGIKPPKGVILYGPPGTGKTLLAKAVANQTSATFLRVVGSELIQKYLVSVCVAYVHHALRYCHFGTDDGQSVHWCCIWCVLTLNLGKNTDYPHLRFFVPVICQHNNFRSWL